MNKTYAFPRPLLEQEIAAAQMRRPMTTDVTGSPVQRNRTLTGTNMRLSENASTRSPNVKIA